MPKIHALWFNTMHYHTILCNSCNAKEYEKHHLSFLNKFLIINFIFPIPIGHTSLASVLTHSHICSYLRSTRFPDFRLGLTIYQHQYQWNLRKLFSY